MQLTRQGNPCKRGHSGLRFVTSRGCVECAAERNAGAHFETDSRKFYGKPCKHGHNGLRYKKAGLCVHCACAKATKFRGENPDKVRQMSVIWRAANRKKIVADKAKYAEENREKVRAANRNAKARKRGAEGCYTAGDVREIRKMQRDTCYYCNTDLCGEGHVDHFTPLARGGTNWPENLCLACQECNLSKGAKDPLKWMVEQELTGMVAIASEGPNPIMLPARIVIAL